MQDCKCQQVPGHMYASTAWEAIGWIVLTQLHCLHATLSVNSCELTSRLVPVYCSQEASSASDDEEWARAVTAGKLSKSDKLTAVDHSTINSPPFRRNFYIEGRCQPGPVVLVCYKCLASLLADSI